METSYDLYKEWNIDCVWEILFLTTHPDYNNKGLASSLTKYSMDYAQKMNNGSLSSEELEKLPIHIRNEKPKALCSLFSSLFTQKIGDKFGFETVFKLSHDDYSFEGKTFAEKVDKIHKYSTFAAKRI